MYGYCKATSSAPIKAEEPIRMLVFLWALLLLWVYGDSRQARRSAADSSLSIADSSLSTADSSLSTADSSLSTADSSLSTANSSLSTADPP